MPRDHDDVRSGLTSTGFLGLVATQFLGSLNDNMFRWLAVPFAQQQIDPDVALSLGLACFTVPYLLFASLAGYLADRFSKRRIIVLCKVAEIVVMGLGLIAFGTGSVAFLFIVVTLMGAQSALFGPAKFGSIPELLKPEKLSAGNGVMGLASVIASAAGGVAGYFLFSLIQPQEGVSLQGSQLWPAAAALLGVAVVGWAASLTIPRLVAANVHREITLNPIAETVSSLRLLVEKIPLFRAALGVAFFWFLASLAQSNLDAYGWHELGLTKSQIAPLLGVLILGVGLGSVLAGLWSGGRVELGIVPIGATVISASCLMLFFTAQGIDPTADIDLASIQKRAYLWTGIWLFVLGMGAGLFNIPLAAFLQDRSDPANRGTILAASNFITFSMVLVAAGLFYFLREALNLSPGKVFLVAGIGTAPVIIYIFLLLPQATIRCLVWLASHTVYRVRVFGRENLPERGGALLVANHVSWLDGVFLLLASSRPIRMIAYAPHINRFGVARMAKMFGVIPIQSGGARSVMRALKTAQEAIVNGELVCIFAEGVITRTGQLQPFQRGMLRIIEGTGAPVVPVYLDELWGSIFSFRGGRFFWKWPRKWPYPVSIFFGPPIEEEPENVHRVQRAVEQLGVTAMEHRKSRQLVPPRRFLRKCKAGLFRSKVADSTGADFTGGKLLASVLAFKRLFSRGLIGDDEKMVGLLLPPSVPAVIANAAVAMMRRVTVNLNYTMSESTVNYCIGQCEIKHVITSRKFMEKRPFNLDAECIFLEDLKDQVTKSDKLIAALQAYACPSALLDRLHGIRGIDPDELFTVIFTSGSTGEPKGVMLTHHNILSNISAVDELFHISKDDVILGVLPFFHSFGFTGTLWLVLDLECKAVYHFNPLDARQIGKLSEAHGVTVVLATPTFLRSYLKRCTPEQMHKLDLVIVGAEKLPRDLSIAFEEKFGVAPTEGYGTTELSPVAAFNIPPHRSGLTDQVTTKLGTVGRPMPGTAAKIVDSESGEELAVGESGLLLIKGPNVMKGYLNESEKTAEVLVDGWYNTGDMARIDEEGFIEITGRQSRFSKIGGEMVPHIKVEETLLELLENPNNDEQETLLAVTGLPHPTKGERLVVLHRPLPISIDELRTKLAENGLPNIWIPAQDGFVEVEDIPLLGTGKLDLKRVKELASEKLGSGESMTSSSNSQ